MTIFRQKQPQGNIDVWWLYDDGGKDSSLSCTTSLEVPGASVAVKTTDNSNEQSSSREADSLSRSQQISHQLYYSNFHYLTHKSPLTARL
jgi:hypothetical protein